MSIRKTEDGIAFERPEPAGATPGPWGCVYTSNHAHDYRLTKPDGSPLPVNAPANDHSEQRANARLIAQAPALRAMLATALDYARHGVNCRSERFGGGDCDCYRAEARALLAAGEGE